MASINTKDHSAYIEVARADPGSVICKSVFSIVAYREVLNRKGGDVSWFDKEVGTMFKKEPQGSRAPDTTKVPIKQVMLVCQRKERRKREVLRFRQIWAPWNDGPVGSTLK